MRIRIQSYKPSKSAKVLARYLGLKRLRFPTAFRPRTSDLIVNWGVVEPLPNARYLNPIESVRTAANKLRTFRALSEANVSIPPFSTTRPEPSTDKWVARTTITGHSGEGIIVDIPDNLPDAPLYTKYIRKSAEYRVIIVNNSVVDVKQKLKRRDFEGERRPYIWNASNGYVFARNGITIPEDLNDLALSAVRALSLTYCALDIAQDSDGILYVLEANTAFGLDGTTIQLVGDAIRSTIYQLQRN